jgi:hypothetical protein
MRSILLLALLISSIALKAQTFWPGSFMNYMHGGTFGNSLHSFAGATDKKWSLSSYSGISTSFNLFNGGNAMVVAAPMGLQLNRRLNNNLYAFAGVSIAPAFVNFNRSFLSSDLNKMYPNNGMYKSNSLGIYSRAEMGLMYTNDARTFFVSGSIGVERSSYPMIPYQQMSRTKPNPAVPLNQ